MPDSDDALLRQPLRLLPLYSRQPKPEELPPRRPPLSIGGGSEAEPLLLLRAGAVDLERVVRCLAVGLQPAALMVNLTESRRVLTTAQRAAARFNVRLGCDPVFHRMALDSYETTQGMRQLAYRPPTEHGPWRPEQLERRRRRAIIARSLVEEEVMAGGRLLLGAGVAVRSIADPWFHLVGHLLEESLLARDGWAGEFPMLAPVAVSLSGFRGRLSHKAVSEKALPAR